MRTSSLHMFEKRDNENSSGVQVPRNESHISFWHILQKWVISNVNCSFLAIFGDQASIVPATEVERKLVVSNIFLLFLAPSTISWYFALPPFEFLPSFYELQRVESACILSNLQT